jgi:alkylhydroperoxidase/carboxymuconolactone decarboxylase family protein YurZ
MYLPKVYEDFSENSPEVFAAYRELGKTCRQAGPIEAKFQDLVNLGIAIGATTRGSVMSQTRKALAAGATPAELKHVALLALTTIGFPKMIAALGWINEVLEKEQPGQ